MALGVFGRHFAWERSGHPGWVRDVCKISHEVRTWK
jgi:hypothetical protein